MSGLAMKGVGRHQNERVSGSYADIMPTLGNPLESVRPKTLALLCIAELGEAPELEAGPDARWQAHRASRSAGRQALTRSFFMAWSTNECRGRGLRYRW